MTNDRNLTRGQCLAAIVGVLALAAAFWWAPVTAAGAGQSPAAAAAAAATQTAYRGPKTAWGDPDLQGVWTNWDRTPFQGPNPDLEEAAAEAEAAQEAYGAEGRGDGAGGGMAGQHSSPVSPARKAQVIDPPDGRVPVIKGKKERHSVRAMMDSWENHGPGTRCITHGAPGGLFASGAGGYSKAYRLIQSPGIVMIVPEMFHDARVIRIGGAHVGKDIKQWNGDSIARWEGDTLVVDTTNYNNKGDQKGDVPQTEALHVVERFTRVGEKTINYEATFEDPNVYSRKWTASQPHNLDPPYVIYEFACHEGNTRFMEGTLKQGRMRDIEEATAAARRKATGK
jgi:hypothetical protein